MSQHLDDIQAALVALARRTDGITAHDAGALIEAADPLERTMPKMDDDGTIRTVRKPGVIGIEARGRRRLTNLTAAGWLQYDAADEVWRVGGGSRGSQRHRRPRRPTEPHRRGRVMGRTEDIAVRLLVILLERKAGIDTEYGRGGPIYKFEPYQIARAMGARDAAAVVREASRVLTLGAA